MAAAANGLLVLELIRCVIPYRDMNFFWRYFNYVESIQYPTPDWRRTADLALMAICYGYFVLNFLLKTVVVHQPSLSLFHHFLHADMVVLFYSRHFYMFELTIFLLIIYFVYKMYVRPNARLVALFRYILLRAPRVRRFALILSNTFMAFIPLIDLAICYYHYHYARLAWGTYHAQLFESGILGWLRLLFHVLNSAIMDLGLLNYFHVCSLIVSCLGMPFLIWLRMRCESNQRTLRRVARTWPLGLAAFTRKNLHNFQYIFLYDSVYGRLFLAYMLLACPTNAFFSVYLLLNTFQDSIILLTVLGVTLHQFICVFAIHLYMASFAKRLHGSSRTLLSLAARQQQHRVGNFRTKISLEITIARLHTNRKYGLTYGTIALINMDTFCRCLFLYGKFLMFSYKIIQTL